MRVRVSYTVDADDDLRRAINLYHGQPGLADREAVRRWYEWHGGSMDADLSVLLETVKNLAEED